MARSFIRTPLFVIILAIIICNVLAYAFFYSFDSTLPRAANGSHFRMQLQLQKLHDRMLGTPGGHDGEQQEQEQAQQGHPVVAVTSQHRQSMRQHDKAGKSEAAESPRATDSTHATHGSTASIPARAQGVASRHQSPVQEQVEMARLRLKEQLLLQRKEAAAQAGEMASDIPAAASLMSAVRTEDIAMALGSMINVLNMKKGTSTVTAKGIPSEVCHTSQWLHASFQVQQMRVCVRLSMEPTTCGKLIAHAAFASCARSLTVVIVGCGCSCRVQPHSCQVNVRVTVSSTPCMID